MKALFIDPTDETIRFISYDGDYKSIYRILGCRTFEAVYPFNNGDTLWIDEEGLLKDSNFAFNIRADNPKFNQTIMGKALVLGTDTEGESIECKTTLEDLKSRINFQGKVAIENDGQGFTLTPWHIYQNNLEEAKLLLEKLRTEGSA
tara:strand:+ start:2217 stop:2657 length:441 start_codon:yes stop_codon:yes gene_type:complete